MKLYSFPNYFKKPKELFDLIIFKISSDGGDFPRIIEIALFYFYSIWICSFLSENLRKLFYSFTEKPYRKIENGSNCE